MKFSKLVMLPLLALGLVACGPASGSDTPAPDTGVTTPTTSEIPAAPTDWDDATKGLMMKNLGFVVPFFNIEGGMWADDPSTGFAYISNPEANLTEKEFQQKCLIPLLQAGMVDSTMNWTFPEDMQALNPIVYTYVDVQETLTQLYNIIIVYSANNAFGPGTQGGMMIVAGPEEPAYTKRDVTDEEQAALVKTAFPAATDLVLPSLTTFTKAAYVITHAEPNVGVMIALGYCASKTNLMEIGAIYEAAGWVVNPSDEKMLIEVYDNAEDPKWMGIIGGFPDGTIRIIINPFSI